MKKILLILSSLLLLTLSACGSEELIVEEVNLPTKTEVRVDTLQSMQGSTNISSYTATVRPIKEIDLSAESSGRVASIKKKVGETVVLSDVLLELGDSQSTQTTVIQYEDLLRNYQNTEEVLASTKRVYDGNIANISNSIYYQNQILSQTRSQYDKQIDIASQEVYKADLALKQFEKDYTVAVDSYQLQLEQADDAIVSAKLDQEYAEQVKVNTQADYDNRYIAMLAESNTLLTNVIEDFAYINSRNSYILSLSDDNSDITPYEDVFGLNNTGLVRDVTIEHSRQINALIDVESKYALFSAGQYDRQDLLADIVTYAEKQLSVSSDMYLLAHSYSIASTQSDVALVQELISITGGLLDLTIADKSQIESNVLSWDSFELEKANALLNASNNAIQADTAYQNALRNLDSLALEQDKNLASLSTQIENAKANLKNANSSLDRTKLDQESQVTSIKSQISDLSGNINIQRANQVLQADQVNSQIDQIKGQIDIMQLQVDGQGVTTPFTGIITDKYVSEGDYVNPGQALFKVADFSEVKIVFYLDFQEAASLEMAQNLPIKCSYCEQKQLSGTINSISENLDPKTKKVAVELLLDNRDLVLKPNSFVEVELDSSSDDKVFIPLDLVRSDQEGESVLLYQDGLAVVKRVELGEILGDQIEVLSGIEMEDQLIVEGASFLSEGDLIKLRKVRR